MRANQCRQFKRPKWLEKGKNKRFKSAPATISKYLKIPIKITKVRFFGASAPVLVHPPEPIVRGVRSNLAFAINVCDEMKLRDCVAPEGIEETPMLLFATRIESAPAHSRSMSEGYRAGPPSRTQSRYSAPMRRVYRSSYWSPLIEMTPCLNLSSTKTTEFRFQPEEFRPGIFFAFKVSAMRFGLVPCRHSR